MWKTLNILLKSNFKIFNIDISMISAKNSLIPLNWTRNTMIPAKKHLKVQFLLFYNFYWKTSNQDSLSDVSDEILSFILTFNRNKNNHYIMNHIFKYFVLFYQMIFLYLIWLSIQIKHKIFNMSIERIIRTIEKIIFKILRDGAKLKLEEFKKKLMI